MGEWIEELIEGIGDAITEAITFLTTELSNTIFDTVLQWCYEMVYDAVADFFTLMGNMGADLFDLSWVRAVIHLFTMFGWALFVAGVVVAIFDVAIEYQNGRASPKTTALNILKGFFKICIKPLCRLVHKKNIRLGKKHLRKCHPLLLAT